VEDANPASFGAAVVTGADGRLVVREVVPGSNAALAGLSGRDQIISINGTAITQPDQFQEFIVAHPADPLRIIVVRDGSQRTIVVNESPRAAQNASRPAIGVRFLQGPNVALAEVVPGSPAETAGLRPGDQIISVNGTPITSSDQFISLIAAAPLTSTLDLAYLRGADRATATFTPGVWSSVFGTADPYVTLKPTADSVAYPVGYYPSYYYPSAYYPYYFYPYVSAIGVPSIAFPTYYYWPYGYTAWSYPYYSPYYAGYYVHPNWYLYMWPAPLRYGGPYPGYPGKVQTKLESARSTVPNDTDRIVEQLGPRADVARH